MQIENMVDATCDTNDLMQIVDFTCHTNDLMQMGDTYTTKDMIDNSLTSYKMESFINSKLMKTFFVEDKSQAEDVKAQNDTKSNINKRELDFSFEVTKEIFMNVWKNINNYIMIFPKSLLYLQKNYNSTRMNMA